MVLSFRVVRGPEAVSALEAEWNTLHSRSRERRFSASYCWCWTSWEAIHKPFGHQLCVLVGAEHGDLVLIWPFVIFPEHRLSRAMLLGTADGEYGHGLMAQSSSMQCPISAAWRYLRGNPIADLISFQGLCEDAELFQDLKPGLA